MSIRFFYISLCVLTAIFFNSQKLNAQQNTSKTFKSGDTVCFLGDSITHGGQFHEFLQLFYATRHPSIALTFYNCGIAGDNSEGMIYRFKDDVLVHNPSHVFFMTGMNDVIRTLYFDGQASDEVIKKRKNALAVHKQNTNILASTFKASEITPIYLTPSIYDQYSEIEKENNLGCNDALIECSNHIKSIANQYDATVVDLNTPMKNIMDRELKNDSLFTIIGQDRVHPKTTGHFIMFHEILSTLETPGVVAQISIDLNQNNLIKTKNCSVNELQVSKENILFNCKENSLPFPFTKGFDTALRLVPFQKKFNQEILQVIGLDLGSYDLFIQDKLINTFSAKQLKDGVNLSNEFNTPQYIQAKEIMNLCQEYRKTGYQLRAVPFINYKYLRDYNGPDRLKNKKIFLDNQLKKIEGQPFYNYIKKSIHEYYKTLPRLDSLKIRLKQIEHIIYKKNKPRAMNWSIVKK
ncbi:SGNH/GDSL hydrolase family protein [Flavobacteriaceae bacterium]|nr:SGNH/GDSL hydrolase family protein [Flavobacteriaceae bacterium]